MRVIKFIIMLILILTLLILGSINDFDWPSRDAPEKPIKKTNYQYLV